MKKVLILCACALSLGACSKLGLGGVGAQMVGDWAEVNLPAGCVVQQIAAEHDNGVAILCKDGRVFH